MDSYDHRISSWLGLFSIPLMLVLSGCLSETVATDGSEPPPPPPSNNSAPQISGQPPQAVTIGQQYVFTPSASDPDGDTLTFSVANLPGWANFDSSTGRVSGTPGLGDVGTWNNIAISVTDGQANASLPAFGVDVVQAALGSTTLSWAAPTLNSDGTPLVDLIGYKIYYGQSPNSYTETISINDPGMTTVFIDDLVPATYYFVATSVRSGGIESELSNVAEITIN